MGWLLLVAGALLLGLATWSTTALLRPASGLDAAVTAGVVAAAGAAACVLAAGALGLLHPGVVLALEAAWAAVATAVAGPPRLRRPRLRLGAAVRAEPWTAALVALAALALAWQALVALVLPPFAYDANTYHLTIVATWLREAEIVPPDLSLCCAYYPATSELLFAWPVLLQGSDALVDLVQLPFAALGGLAVAGIARTAGLAASRGGRRGRALRPDSGGARAGADGLRGRDRRGLRAGRARPARALRADRRGERGSSSPASPPGSCSGSRGPGSSGRSCSG